MQIYTQNLNHTRKNMNFFLSQRANRSTSFLKVNESTGQRVNEFWVCSGSAWVCFGSVKKITPISSIKPDLHLIKK